jgi:hypothetical protein
VFLIVALDALWWRLTRHRGGGRRGGGDRCRTAVFGLDNLRRKRLAVRSLGSDQTRIQSCLPMSSIEFDGVSGYQGQATCRLFASLISVRRAAPQPQTEAAVVASRHKIEISAPRQRAIGELLLAIVGRLQNVVAAGRQTTAAPRARAPSIPPQRPGRWTVDTVVTALRKFTVFRGIGYQHSRRRFGWRGQSSISACAGRHGTLHALLERIDTASIKNDEPALAPPIVLSNCSYETASVCTSRSSRSLASVGIR